MNASLVAVHSREKKAKHFYFRKITFYIVRTANETLTVLNVYGILNSSTVFIDNH